MLAKSNTVVRRMGPEGIDLVRRSQTVDETYRRAAGPIQANVDRLWRPGRDRTAAFDRLRAFHEGLSLEGKPGKIDLTPKEQKLDEIVGPYLDAMVERARRAAPKSGEMPSERILLDLGMDKLPTKGLDVGELPNYWPIMIDEAKISRDPSTAVQAIMDRTGMDATDALAALRRFLSDRNTGRPFGNLERKREAWAPYFVRLPAEQEFFRYVEGAERRLAQAQFYGPYDQIVNARIAKLREGDPQHGAFARAWFETITGTRPDEVMLEDLARQITTLQVASKMLFSVFSNAAQKANVALKTDLTTFGRTFFKYMSGASRAEMVDFTKRAGGLLEQGFRDLAEYAGAREGTIGETTLRRTGFMGVEGGNWVFSAAAGREWARDLSAAYARLSGKNVDAPLIGYFRRRGLASIERHMDELGLDKAAILERAEGKQPLLTKDDELLAGLRMAKLTQFGPDAGEIPLFWSHPWGRVLVQFSNFAYRQGNLVYKTITEEAKHGNLKPLLVFLSVFPVIGEGVADIRYLVRRGPAAGYEGFKKEGTPGAVRGFFGVLSDRPTDPIERAMENMAYMGGIGVASNLIRAMEARNLAEAAGSTLFGPTLTDVVETVASGLQTARDVQRAESERAKPEEERRRVDFTGLRRLARKTLSYTVTPGLTAVAGVPGAALGRALEGAEVFRSPSSVRRQLAQRIAEAVERDDEETATRLQDEYVQKFGRPANLGNILRARRQRLRRPR